jgi:hypothetical protein
MIIPSAVPTREGKHHDDFFVVRIVELSRMVLIQSRLIGSREKRHMREQWNGMFCLLT